MPVSVIFDLLERQSRVRPQQVFLQDLQTEQAYSYSSAFDAVTKIILFLELKNAPATLALLASSNLDTAIAYCGIICSGRTVVVLDDAVNSVYRMQLTERHMEICFEPTELIANAQSLIRQIPDVFEPPVAHEIESCLLTSGSTGDPKIFGIPTDRHGSEVDFDSEGDDYIVLNVRRASTTPYRRNLRRALLHGGCFLHVDLSTISPSDLDDRLGKLRIRELTVTPTMIRTLFPHFANEWTKNVQVVHVNGERTTKNDLLLVFEKMPQSKIRRNYGSTEFGGIAEDLLDIKSITHLSDPISVGHPVIDVSIRDETGKVELPCGVEGNIYVRNASGYEGNLTSSGKFVFNRFEITEWLETGDQGYFNDDQELVVIGRHQETLKIRGTRVSILEVEEIIRATGLVDDVLVASYKDQNDFEAIGVLVVSNSSDDVQLAELRRRIAENHPLIMCPTRLVIIPKLPVLVSGKLDRLTATEILNNQEFEEIKVPENATSKVVIKILSDILSVETLSASQDIFEAGLDSLSSLEVLEELSEAFGIQLDIRVLLENPTCDDLSEAIGSYMAPSGRVVHLGKPSNEMVGRIYWILPGANPYMIQRMTSELNGYRHYGVLNHGCMPDDVVTADVTLMVQSLVDAILKEADLSQSFFIGGFSSAALLASEVVRIITGQGIEVRGLVLLDPVSPSALQANQIMVNPVHLMLGREGRMSSLDPVQRDHALFGLQLFALARLTPQPLRVPVLQIATRQSFEQRQLWTSHKDSKFIELNIDHLDYLRKPKQSAIYIKSFFENSYKNHKT